MGRLVAAGRRELIQSRGGGLESVGGEEVIVGGDGYQDRLAKYIPGEIIGAYLAIDRNLVPSARESAKQLSGGSLAANLSTLEGIKPWMPLVIGLAFTPLYFWQLARTAGPRTPWRTQAVVSTMAFLVWAYAIQGSAFVIGSGGEGTWYNGPIAAMLLIVFSLFAAIFHPVPAGYGDHGVRTHT